MDWSRTLGKPLSISGLYHVFHNPFYYGWYEYPLKSGKWHEGKHEPMITKADFDRVQALLAKNSSPRSSEHLAFPYTGLIRCGSCGGMITAEEKQQVRCADCRYKFASGNRSECPRCKTPLDQMRNAQTRHYTYYRCARRKAGCRQPSVETQNLEHQIEMALQGIYIPASFKQWAFRYLREIYLDDLNTASHASASREKALTNCLMRLEKLVDLKTSPQNTDGSLLSDEEYSSQRRKLLLEKAALQSPNGERLEAKRALNESEENFAIAHSAPTRFAQATDFEAKKELLVKIGSNRKLKDKTLIFEAKKPFILIQQFKSYAETEIERFEPEKSLVKSRRKGPSGHVSLRRLRDVNKVRTRGDKLKILVSKVYQHFKMSVAFGPNVNN